MIGTTLAHYEVTDRLGAGGMSEVWEARDRKLGRDVALKVLPDDLAADPDRLDRFRREARLVAALNHPNIVTVYSIEEADGLHFLTMELVRGATLGQLLPPGGFTEQRCLELAVPITEAVAAAHDQGIVHRDLKATNVMVRRTDEVVKILDFGLAKAIGRPETPALESMSTEDLTQQGLIIGTLPYMSPEQIQGQRVDKRTDVFSLGVVLYEMLTGKRPFHADNSPALISSILRDRQTMVSEIRDRISLGMTSIVDRCLEKDPDRRYADGRALASELARVVPGQSLSPSRALTGAAVPDAARRRSIAVLPFLNRSGNPEDDYFSDGLSEELINSLGSLPGIKVTARSSAFQFRGKELDVREVGQRLGVDAVLEGSVRIAGRRLRITTQLAGCDDGLQIWSERFDGEMTHVFDTQDEIVKAIVDQLQVQLEERSSAALFRHGTDDLEAYHLLLRARHHMSEFWEPGLVAALECLNRAVELDQTYADAYAARAECYFVRANFGNLPGRDAHPKIRSAIRRALELDPNLGSAHALHGVSLAWHDADWDGADRELRTAVELSPQNVWVHLYSAAVMSTARRAEEILGPFERARELDPLNPMIHAHAILFSFYAGRSDDAVNGARKSRERFPDFWLVPYFEALVRWQRREAEDAVRLIEQSLAMTGESITYLACFAAAIHFFFDRTSEAERWLDTVEGMAETQYVSPTGRALIEIARNRSDAAISYLELARSEQDAPFAWSRALCEALGIIRDEPVRQAMARLGLP